MDIFYKYALCEVAPDSAAGPDFNAVLEHSTVKDLKHWDTIQLVTWEQQYPIFMDVPNFYSSSMSVPPSKVPSVACRHLPETCVFSFFIKELASKSLSLVVKKREKSEQSLCSWENRI